jgi:hypothetical protein
MRRNDLPATAAFAALICVAAGVRSEEAAYPFMPPGGRTILLEIVGGDPKALAEAALRKASATDWAEWARTREPALSDAARDTFAGYAALNFPVATDVATAIGETGDAARLPRDGKDLAIAQCQFCHSFFTGYLMQDRDETSWRGTFKAPFHAEIPMTEDERNTFAHYSAINMPLKFTDVPPELRF